MSISIIIPVYNVKPYLNECINSVIIQTYTDFECILIDDGSTDGSSEICDQWAEKDNRIKVIHQQNQGVSAARNLGIKYSKGEYITFLDSDDTYYNNSVLDEYYKHASKGFNLIAINYITRHYNKDINTGIPTKIKNRIYSWKNNPEIFISDAQNGFYFVVWNKLFRSSIIKSNKLKFNNQQMEDFKFILDYLKHIDSICQIEFIGIVYNKYPNLNRLSTYIHPNSLKHYTSIHSHLINLFPATLVPRIHELMFPQYFNVILRLIYANNQSYNYINKIIANKYVVFSINSHLKQCNSLSEKISLNLIKKKLYTLFRIYRYIVSTIKKR